MKISTIKRKSTTALATLTLLTTMTSTAWADTRQVLNPPVARAWTLGHVRIQPHRARRSEVETPPPLLWLRRLPVETTLH